MKIDFIADTNILIYIHEGNKIVEPLLEYNFGISFITADKGFSRIEELDLILVNV
jgi:hypothetical protein